MSHSEMEAELTCPICMELFQKPRRLPCGHSYCHACIEAMLSKYASESRSYLSFSRPLICPECRDEINLDFVEGIEAIPLDFKLTKLVELFQFMKKSSDSDDENVSASAGPLEPRSVPTATDDTSSNHINDAASASRSYSSHSTLPSVPEIDSLAAEDRDDNLNSEGGNSASTNQERTSENSCPDIVPRPESDFTSIPSHSLDITPRQDVNLSCDVDASNNPGQNPLSYEREGTGLITASEESLLGAVGGVSLPEASRNVFSRTEQVRSHIQGRDFQVKSRNSFDNSRSTQEGEVQYIASALSPSVTVTPSQHLPKLSTNLAKFESSRSYSELPSNQIQTQVQNRFSRAQSVPLETKQDNVSSQKNKKFEPKHRRVDCKPSASGIRKSRKKKKGRNWMSLFKDDTSSSDDDLNSSTDTEERDSSKPQVPEVKKGRLVARFLRSIILSDSSSSDWSNDSEEEQTHERTRGKSSSDQAARSEAVRRQTSVAKSQADAQPKENPGSENSSIACTGNQLTNDSESSNDQRRNSAVATDIVRQESVPATNAHTSIDSNTLLKEVAPQTTSESKEDNTLDSSRQFHTNNAPELKCSEERGADNLISMTIASQESKFNLISASRACQQESPTHYDNVPNRNQTGISELDVMTSTTSQPNSPLVANPTLYDNVSHTGQRLQAAGTLYDNITDSELILCRLEAEAALVRARQGQQAHENSGAEIENLKTGFEDMERSAITRSGLSNSGCDFQESGRQVNVNSPVLVQQDFPQNSNSGPNRIAHENDNLKEASLPALTPDGGNHRAVFPTRRPTPFDHPAATEEPFSMYDNVDTDPRALSKWGENIGPQQQNPPMPLRPSHHHHQAELPHVGSGSNPKHPGSQQLPAATEAAEATTDLHVNRNPAVLPLDGATGCAPGSSRNIEPARMEQENASACEANDNNNNENPREIHNSFEEDDDVNDEGARMLQPRRKPRSKFRKFITSLLSLSSSSDEDEPYYVNNTSSSSKSSDW